MPEKCQRTERLDCSKEPVGDAMRRIFGKAGFVDLDPSKRDCYPRDPFENSAQ